MKTQVTRMQRGRRVAIGAGRGTAISRIISITLFVLALLPVGTPPAGATNLYALVDTGELYFSDDEGASWAVRASLPCRDAIALAARETAEELYLATATGVLHRSLNAGVDWIWQGAIPASDVCAMLIREEGAILLLTETGTVWESVDGGVQFTALGTITASDLVSMTPTASSGLCAVTETGTVAVSSDQGATWETRGAITASDLVEIVLAGSDLVALTSTGDVWKSIDDGASWQRVGSVSQVHMASAISDDSGALFAAAREGEIAHSVDGAEWNWIGATNQLNVVALAIDAPASGVTPQALSVASFRIGSAWPNPLWGQDHELHLQVSSERSGAVRLCLLDAEGRCVHEGAAQPLHAASDQRLSWSLGNLPAGVYHARLSLAGSSERAGTRVVLVQ